VHRLVAQEFLVNKSNGINVCHKDDNPLNNQVNNLFWGTQGDNVSDMVSKNRQFRPIGIANPKSKLNEKQIRVFQWVFKINSKFPKKLIAKIGGVHQSTIYKMNKGTTWNHLTI
jgi:hypothetical protein